ncbi:hypothetical protein BJF81_00170 [Ornithinimicrobium sp. CNJ-824]|nr:hypothetical protein BJF81_00170 [Ornithinimicrobium sp. CNJ-824]
MQELASKVYERKDSDKEDKRLALKVLEKARDQGSLERLLLTTIENVLIDEAKATETGKLRRRLINVLGKDARFVHLSEPEECWALQGGPQSMWQGDLDVLIQAALRVRGYEIRSWNTAGPTAAPVALALRQISHGVLAHADAAVRAQELATVLRIRFVHIAPLNAASMTAVPAEAAPVTQEKDNPENVVILEIAADTIWSTLTPTERMVVAYIGQDPNEWARSCSLRPRQAAAIVAALIAKLQAAVSDEERAEDLIRELHGRSVEEGLGPPELRRLLMLTHDDSTDGEGHA